MDAQVGQATIFLPMLAVVALSIVAFLRLMVLRIGAVRRRLVRMSFYRVFQGEPEPEAVAAAARHYNNLFEAPVLFYAGCIVAFEIGAVTPSRLAWAWAFVAARLAQSTVHLTHNSVRWRAYAFLAGWVFLVALWLGIGAALLRQI